MARYAAGGTTTSDGNGMKELSITMKTNTKRYEALFTNQSKNHAALR